MKFISEQTENNIILGLDFGELGAIAVTIPRIDPSDESLVTPPPTDVSPDKVRPPTATFQHFAVDSSNIEYVSYAEGDGLLRVMFHSGEEYEYEGVSVETLRELVDAESVGRYFNRVVKNGYPCRHLVEVD